MTLPATLSIGEATSIEWDVVVIGAGVGGAMAARELARLDCRVLLIDKKSFPRRKVCGACLNSTALDLLSQVGLPELIDELGGTPLHRLALRTSGRQVDLPLHKNRSVSREALDTALIQAAIQSGAAFLPETAGTIVSDAQPSPYRTISLSQHDNITPVRARVVIVASGLGAQGLPASEDWATQTQNEARVGIGCVVDSAPVEFAPETIWMAVGRYGYVGLVTLEDGRLNVAAAVDRHFLAECKSPCVATKHLLTDVGLPCPAMLSEAEWHGTVSLTRHTTPLAGRQVLLIGDAASYVEPFTGEGMAWAMQAGFQVAPWARLSLQGWSEQIERGWGREYQRQIQRQQRTCRVVSHLLHNSRLQAMSMLLLQRFPWLARCAMSR